MSRKESMVKRKFSFEIPKLKIGTNKTSKDQSRTEYSPPATPKSVRPPLSPRTDHQLRLACAYVLQDFKPSHQIYEERYGRGEEDKPRLSYPAADKLRGRKDEAAEAPVVRKSSNRKHSAEASGSGKPKMKPTIKSQAFFEGLHVDSNTMDAPSIPDRQKWDQMVDEEIRMDLSNSNPPIASPAFFAGVDLERLRREQFPGTDRPIEAAITREIAQANQIRSPLKRSMSNPLTSKVVSVEPSRPLPRSESADTTASSPRTDGTENAWSNSTAPTTTVVTPARGSLNRASQPPGSEKFLTSDIEWMRQELEKHKRAQDEARAQLELENQVLASLGLEPRSSLPKPLPPTSAQMLASRKADSNDGDAQIGTFTRGRSASQSIQERRNVPPVPLLDSVQNERLARSESRKQRSTPRSESKTELDMLRPESRQSQHSRRGSQESSDQSRSISRDIKGFFKNSSSEALAGGETSTEMSRASSRSRRLFQINIRPHDGTGAPPGSLQSSKPHSRSRSIESIRSAVSGIAPSLDSAANKMRGWKSFSRSQDSGSENDGSRPGTSLSKRQSRDLSRESLNSPSDSRNKKGKSNINLNRELPPLPSLDQWKPEEPPEEKPKHIASMASPTRSRRSDSPITSEPSPLQNQGDLSPDIIHHSATTSRIQSIYSRYSKIRDSWRPDHALPYSALASPTLPPEIVHPDSSIDQTFDFGSDSGTASSMPQSPIPPSPAYVAVEEAQPSPAYLAVEERQQRVPSEYMFHRNFGAPTVPASPVPPLPQQQEQQFLVPPSAPPKTIKRRTEDMFLPDLDAKARSNSVDDNDTSSKGKRPEPPAPMKRQNTLPLLYKPSTNTSTSSNSHSKSQSEQINFSRKPSTDNYSRLYDMGYRNIVQLQPQQQQDEQPRVLPQQQQQAVVPGLGRANTTTAIDRANLPVRKESKRWWKRATSVKKLKDAHATGLPQRSSSRMWKGDLGATTLEEDESAPTVVRF